MADYREVFVGIDVAKLKNAIAVAESGREGEIRFWGEVDASDASMRRVIQRIAAKFDRVHFCYEVGPTGYGLHRLIRSLGYEWLVVAPSLIPRKPGDRVKTNRRDAVALARLLRAGELTAVWIPDEGHEAIRDLVRARAAAVETLRVHRQQNATISEYLEKHRPVLLGEQADPGTFFVKRSVRKQGRADFDQLSFYAAWRVTIEQFGIYNPYTGRGAIKGLLPHGPHCICDVLATHVVKMTGSFELAGYAIQDTPPVVARHYGRFLPSEKGELVRKVIQDAWND